MLIATIVLWRVQQQPRMAAPPVPQQVTYTGDLIEASLSPDGELLAALSSASGQPPRLFVRDLEGGQQILLHEADGFLFCPQWSADGSSLLFYDGPRGRGSSVIMPRLGGPARKILADVVAIWSPDGSQILSWWPQAQRFWLTDVASGDTIASVPISPPHDWVQGADWSPDGDRLALVTLLQGTSTLSTMTLEGSSVQELHRDTLGMLSPRWAPDGSAVYYLRRVEDPGHELWKIRVSNGERRGAPERVLPGITVSVRNGAIPSFSLAADGRRMLYNRILTRANLRLFELDPAATNGVSRSTDLTSGTAIRVTPRISPDRERLVYVQSAGRGSNLFTLPLGGGEPTQLTFGEADSWSPSWSPDGSLVAFGSAREGQPDVWVVPSTGGTARGHGATDFEGRNLLAWAPGQQIAYQRSGDLEFYMVDPGSHREESLALGNMQGWIYDPRPAPDGRRVAVLWNLGASDSTGLWVLSPDSAPVLVAPEYIPLGWSSDGTVVYAMQTRERRDEVREIHAITVSTGQSRLLATLPEPVMPWNVSIAPDGRLVVAAVEQRQTDAWIVDNFDPTAR